MAWPVGTACCSFRQQAAVQDERPVEGRRAVVQQEQEAEPALVLLDEGSGKDTGRLLDEGSRRLRLGRRGRARLAGADDPDR